MCAMVVLVVSIAWLGLHAMVIELALGLWVGMAFSGMHLGALFHFPRLTVQGACQQGAGGMGWN